MDMNLLSLAMQGATKETEKEEHEEKTKCAILRKVNNQLTAQYCMPICNCAEKKESSGVNWNLEAKGL